MIVEPDDAVTGRLLGEVERLRCWLAERDDGVPGLGTVDARVWRAQFEPPDAQDTPPAHRRSPAHGYRSVDPWRPRIGRPRSTILVIGDHTSCGRGTDISSHDHSMISLRSLGRGPRPPTASTWPESWLPGLATRTGSGCRRRVRHRRSLPIERPWHPVATRSRSWRTALIAPTRWDTENRLNEWQTSA